jgi:hypothetical protein
MRKESVLYGASSLVRPVKLIEYAADPPAPLASRTEPAIFTVFGNDAVYMAIAGLPTTIGAGVGAFFGGAAAVCAPTSARPESMERITGDNIFTSERVNVRS